MAWNSVIFQIECWMLLPAVKAVTQHAVGNSVPCVYGRWDPPLPPHCELCRCVAGCQRVWSWPLSPIERWSHRCCSRNQQEWSLWSYPPHHLAEDKQRKREQALQLQTFHQMKNYLHLQWENSSYVRETSVCYKSNKRNKAKSIFKPSRITIKEPCESKVTLNFTQLKNTKQNVHVVNNCV